jgi:hypothetical protein
VVELQGGAARQLAGWMHELGHVAAEAFDVSYYTVTSRHAQAQLVFYGVETNAGCAAYAYAASHTHTHTHTYHPYRCAAYAYAVSFNLFLSLVCARAGARARALSLSLTHTTNSLTHTFSLSRARSLSLSPRMRRIFLCCVIQPLRASARALSHSLTTHTGAPRMPMLRHSIGS